MRPRCYWPFAADVTAWQVTPEANVAQCRPAALWVPGGAWGTPDAVVDVLLPNRGRRAFAFPVDAELGVLCGSETVAQRLAVEALLQPERWRQWLSGG